MYLGANVNASNDISEEIRNRIMVGCRGLYALGNILRSKQLGRAMKIRIYKSILRPAVLYGCETWTLTQESEQRLGIFERKVLRTIYGPVQDSAGDWRIRYNSELKALYREPDIVAVAKTSRLRWAGHVERMREDCLTRKILHGNLYKERTRGKPRSRWLNNIEADLTKAFPYGFT